MKKLGNSTESKNFNGDIVSSYSYNPTDSQLAAHVTEYLSNSNFKQYPNKGYGVDMAKEIAKDMQARGAGVYAVKGKATLRTVDGGLVNLSLGKDLKWTAKISKAYLSNQKQSKVQLE